MSIEIGTLSNETEEFNLSDYKEAKIEQSEPETSESIIQNLGEDSKPADAESNNETPLDPTKWQGDKRYFQTGKRAGQLRPNPKISATYNVNATTTIPATMLINGALFLTVVNIIFPLVIVAVNNWLSPKDKMTVKEMKLTVAERAEINPLMDATLKQLNIAGNPLILLIITLTASYAGKFMAAKLGNDEEEEEKKKE